MFYLWKNLLTADDNEVWIQLIIVAIIIGFSIIKGIVRSIKMMAEKQKEQSQLLLPAEHPAGKRYVAADDDTYKTLEQLREERIAQIRQAFGISQPPAEKKPVTIEKSVATEEPVAAKNKLKKPIASPLPEKKETHTGKKKVPIPAEVLAEETIHTLLLSTPEDLRNAILYQEILGKPLAMRDE
jgi:hypothetical protein